MSHATPPTSAQLSLWQYNRHDVWRGIPWEGWSPRVLTKVRKKVTLTGYPTGAVLEDADMERWSDPDQLLLELWEG